LVIAFAVLLFHLTPGMHVIPKTAIVAASPAQPAKALPVAPAPKGVAVSSSTEGTATSTLLAESNAPAAQNSQALDTIHLSQLPPAKPSKVLGVEGVPSRKEWLLLSIADHSAAAFDAYSTRAAISRGATEANPLIRPFAGSDGLYAAIQVAPFALDFVARRMQRSQNGLLRRTWWLLQSVSTGVFLFAGVHNLGVSSR
jgi:hypothetical protein